MNSRKMLFVHFVVLFVAYSCFVAQLGIAAPVEGLLPQWLDDRTSTNISSIPIVLVQNMEAVLNCKARRFNNITWYKDGELLIGRQLGKVKFLDRNQTIKLPGAIAAYDKGIYSCLVQNRIGTIRKNFNVDIIIQHRGPPEFTMVPENLTVFVDSEAELRCKFLSGEPAYVQWVQHTPVNGSFVDKNGTLLFKVVQSGPSSETDPGLLHFNRTRFDDSGWYSCIVSNQHGSENRMAYLDVVPRPTQFPPLLFGGLHDTTNVVAIGIAAGVPVIMISVFLAVFCRFYRIRSRKPALPWVKNTLYGPNPVIIPIDIQWEIGRENLQIGEQLGEGAFGRVCKGIVSKIREESLSMVVAVKMLKDCATEQEAHDFVLEMEMMKSIGRHINIVNFLGCCSQPDGPLLVVVEFALNGNLLEFLRKRRPSDVEDTSEYLQQSTLMDGESPLTTLTHRELYSFSFQIARGMEYLASIQIIHRDLAARNVLVNEDLVLKIADFGLTREVKEKNYYRKTTDGRLPVKWMAPESLIAYRYTTKSDVWSYGVLLWEIFSFGSNPYPTVPVEDLFQLLRHGHRMEQPSYATAEVYSTMLRCWQDSPDDRPSFTDLVEFFDQQVAQSSPINYLHLVHPEIVGADDEAPGDDEVFSESDRLTGRTSRPSSLPQTIVSSDSQYASLSSSQTGSPSNSLDAINTDSTHSPNLSMQDLDVVDAVIERTQEISC